MKQLLTLTLCALGLVGCMTATAQAPAAAYNVTLAWDASSDATVTSYKMYEHINTTYLQVASTSALTITLQNVSGGTHLYVCTALNAAGLESVYSNEAVVNVPVPPQPPTNLRATVIKQ